MYLRQSQESIIREAAEQIVTLATLENCGLSPQTKDEIQLWVKWFTSYGVKILNTLDEGKLN